jgi:tRNA (guanine37-N1)-methyltransferase
MKFDVLTLFPEMFEPVKQSIIGRAILKKILDINFVDIRDFSEDKHKHVDDTPYGGGAGMLIKPDVVYRAYNSIENRHNAKLIYLTPQGKNLTQSKVEELAKEEHIILLCGHYEGIDQRVIDKMAPEEISVGDYVLTGGELPAMIIIDSVSRYVEGVLSKGSTSNESFEGDGLLEYPQYTKPEVFEGMAVPEILKSGHHQNIEIWRRQKAIENTYKKRPELLEKANLTEEDKKFLEELKKSSQGV